MSKREIVLLINLKNQLNAINLVYTAKLVF